MNIFLKVIIGLYLLSNTAIADIVIAYANNNTVYEKEPSPSQIIEINKIKKIAQVHNIVVSFKPVPWKRALLMVEKGVIDGVINASYKQNRSIYAVYPRNKGILDSDKRLNSGNTFFIYRHIDSSLRWNGKVFTKGGSVGVKEHYAVISDLKQHSNISIEEFISNTEIIRKVFAKKLDGYAAAFEEANALIEKFPLFANNIVKEPIPIRRKEYFLIFSKKTYKKRSKEMELIWSGFKKINTQK